MTRVPHWQRALRDAIHAHARKPFAYGSNDCCSFVCDCVQAMTGEDIYAEFRGKYADKKSALAAMKTIAGSASVEAATDYVTEKSGMEAISPFFAQRGDVVLLPVGENEELALGIVAHDNLHALAVAENGLNKIRFVRIAKKAWRVG